MKARARLAVMAACAAALTAGASEMWWREGRQAPPPVPHCMANGLKPARPVRFLEDPAIVEDGSDLSAKGRIRRELRAAREAAEPGASSYAMAMERPLATPEPTTALLLLIGSAALTLRRNGGRKHP